MMELFLFFFLINGEAFKDTNAEEPSYNRLFLNEIGIKKEPIELSFSLGNYIKFKISLKITSNQLTSEGQKEKDNKEKDNINNNNSKDKKKNNEKKKMVSFSQIFNFNSEDNTQNNLNDINKKEQTDSKNKIVRKDKKALTVIEKSPLVTKPNDNSENKNEKKDSKKEESLLDFGFLKFWKKKSPIVEEEDYDYIESQDLQNEIDFDENYLKGTYYDMYLSKLKADNKKETDIGRETFCEGFFIASFPQKEGQVIENSQSFPSSCGHKECSSLPAMMPEIITRYPLEDTKNLELNNLAATICFPTGIKVCYSEESPAMIKDYVTPITNQKGERYYMMTYHFYYKIMNDVYNKLYEMHPLKHHLMKFGDSYLDLNDKEMDKYMEKIQNNLEKAQELGFREYVYVPYCICLISKYPYVNQMKKCLQSI